LKTNRKSLFLRLFLSILSGIILCFAFPPSVRWQVAFFALLPLLLSAEDNSGKNFLFGITGGFFFYAITLSWLYNVAGPIYLLLALYLSIYWGVFLYLTFALPEKGRIFTGAFLWFLLEIIMTNLITGFPWLSLGLSQWQNFRMLKVAGLFGMYGISALVILGNLTLFYAFRKRYIASLIVSIVVFAAVFLLPSELFYKDKEGKGTLNVMIVQPNVDASKEQSPYAALDALEFLTVDNLKDRNPDVIIWPEGSFPDNIEKYKDVYEGLRELTGKYNTALIMGTFTSAENEIYNSSLLIEKDRVQIYNKNHLVPYGEFIIGRNNRFIRETFERMAGYIPTTKHGKGLKVFTVRDEWKIAPLICFENIFPCISRDFVQAGAEVFVVITNDSWFDRSAGPHQHFAHNVIRAAETGRYFVQGSLTGISGVVSPEGEIKKTVCRNGEELFVEGVLFQNIPLISQKTLYSQTGDIPLFLISVISIGVILCRRKG
jgi:apolipoprotein N-acyltransferase